MSPLNSVCLGSSESMTAAAERSAEPPSQRSATYDNCIRGSGAVDFEMARCDEAELERQNVQLNATYTRLKLRLKADRRALLIKAERAWLTARDSDCAYTGSADLGATSYSSIVDGCLMQANDQRLKLLQHDLEMEEKYGD